MNIENNRKQRAEEVTIGDQKVAKMTSYKVRKEFKRIKRRNTVGPDGILYLWRYRCVQEGQQ